MNLSGYQIIYSGGYFTGSTPAARTFATLGVTAARMTATSLGGDYFDLTVAANVASVGLPFVPLARHDIIDPNGVRRFTGWLTAPTRTARAAEQGQTFRLQGPSYLLSSVVYRQPWQYPVDATNYLSDIAPQLVAKVLLCRTDYATNTRVNVRAQIQAILDYAIKQGVPFTYAGLTNIPDCQPPEDEQVAMHCLELIQRLLRWVPKVSMWWSYNTGNPVLNFSANDAVNAAHTSGGSALAVTAGLGLVGVPGEGGIVIDVNSGVLTAFDSVARADLLVGKVTVEYGSESDVTDDGSPTGTRKLWANLSTDVSTFDNGSLLEIAVPIDLRGAGGPRDPVTGLRQTPQELPPVGLAAAIHEPFKLLCHSIGWAIVGADVDWATVPGLAVGVLNSGDSLLAGSRSIINSIARDIGTGTTTYAAGPPAQLSTGDIINSRRYTMPRTGSRGGGGGGGGGRDKNGADNSQPGPLPPSATVLPPSGTATNTSTRNNGRENGSGGTYSAGGGPNQQDTGLKTPPGGGGGSGGQTITVIVPSNGQLYEADVLISGPLRGPLTT